MSLTLVLLAAGLGSRYGGPKQLDPLGPGGETLMDYAAFDAARAGFSRLVAVTRRTLVPAVRESLVARAGARLEVVIAEQELDHVPSWAQVPKGREAPWGTAQAVLVARDAVRGPFAVVNADDFYGAASYRVLAGALREAASLGRAAPWANVAFPLRATMSEHGAVNRAVCAATPDGWLARVVEQRGIARAADGGGDVRDQSGEVRRLPPDQLVSMNCWAFTPLLFAELDAAFTAFLRGTPGLKDECLLPTVVNDALAAGRARARLLSSEGPWCGVTHREDRPGAVAALAALHAAGAYPARLFA
ncbi:MAG: NTP transferase domain-containing protein [Gemmatimonadetes bacterium]|nr:NTP transferase domain-containing protein [Gemmatimonadota bacterium]